MNQQDNVYIIQNANRSTLALPNPAQGANELAKPRLTSKHATSWALAKTLLRERLISKTTFTNVQVKSIQAPAKTLHRAENQQDHVYIIQTCKHLGSCQNLAEGAISQQDHVYTLKKCKSRAFKLLPNSAQAANKSARPRLHESKCKSRALKLLPKPDSGNEEPTRPRLQHSNMQMKSSSSC